MRHVVELVFRSICPHLTPIAFQQLTEIFEKKTGKDLPAGQDDEDDEEEEEEDSEENEDGEMNGGEIDEDEDSEEEEEDEDEDEDSSEDENDKDEGEVDKELEKKIRKALGEAAVNAGNKSDDDDDDSDEEDDEEEDLDMDAADPTTLNVLDQALANIFKQKKEKEMERKEKIAARESMNHFVLRVLDLITIFIKEQPTDPKIILLVKPLLMSMQHTQNRLELSMIHDKTVSVFRTKLCQSKEYPRKDVDRDEIHQVMKHILDMAKRSGTSPIFVEQVSQGLIFLVKVLRGHIDSTGPSPLKTRSQRKRKVDLNSTQQPATCSTRMSSSDETKVVELYEDALENFMQKKSSVLQAKMFMEFINRFPNIAWKLGFCLSKHLNTACNNFRKVKCSEMLKALFSHKIAEDTEYVQKIGDALVHSFIQMFDGTKEDKFTLKPRQLSDIVRLVDEFKKIKQAHPKIKIDWAKLVESLENILSSPVASRCISLVQVVNSKIQVVKGFI